jgi:hypothetical protein
MGHPVLNIRALLSMARLELDVHPNRCSYWENVCKTWCMVKFHPYLLKSQIFDE